MTEPKTYPTFVSHNQYANALASATSLKGNTVTFDPDDLPESLKSKIYGAHAWMELTLVELCHISDARHASSWSTSLRSLRYA